MKTYIRTVKPGYEGHYGLFALEQRTGLPIRNAYRALWGVTDRAGRFEWRPDELKRYTIPLDPCDMRDVLAALEAELYVVRYVVRGRAYGWMPTLGRHQSFNAREAGSVRPPPPRGVIAWYESAAFAQNVGEPFDVPNPLSDPNDAPAGWRAVLAAHAPRPDRGQNGNGASANGHNDLHDRSRVTDASATRQLPVPTASARDADEHSIPSALALTQFNSEGIETLSSETEGDRGDRYAGTQQQALPQIKGKRDVAAIQRRLATVLDQIVAGQRPALAPEQWRRVVCEMLFGYWVRVMDRPNSFLVPNDKREALVNARLDENGDDVGEVAYAIDGVRRSKHHMGENDRNTQYNTLDLICRDRQHVEKYAALVPAYRRGEPHPLVVEHAALLLAMGAPAGVRDQLAQLAKPVYTGSPTEHPPTEGQP